MNEIKITFDEEKGNLIFSSSITQSFITETYSLQVLTDQDFKQLVYLKSKQLFDYYKKHILDQG